MTYISYVNILFLSGTNVQECGCWVLYRAAVSLPSLQRNKTSFSKEWFLPAILCDCVRFQPLLTAPESDLPVSRCSRRFSTLAENCCFREGALGPRYVPAPAAPTWCGACVPELTASLRPVSPHPCQQKFVVFCLLNTPQIRAPGDHSRLSWTHHLGRMRADTGLESGCSLVARNSPEWASCRLCKNDFSQTL